MEYNVVEGMDLFGTLDLSWFPNVKFDRQTVVTLTTIILYFEILSLNNVVTVVISVT
jgi:hypothetical protein